MTSRVSWWIARQREITKLEFLNNVIGRHGRNHMVVGFTTYAISAYHH
jgi:hypothetical protein